MLRYSQLESKCWRSFLICLLQFCASWNCCDSDLPSSLSFFWDLQCTFHCQGCSGVLCSSKNFSSPCKRSGHDKQHKRCINRYFYEVRQLPQKKSKTYPVWWGRGLGQIHQTLWSLQIQTAHCKCGSWHRPECPPQQSSLKATSSKTPELGSAGCQEGIFTDSFLLWLFVLKLSYKKILWQLS